MARALVTGTSSGLGQGLARQLLAKQWDVFGCSRRPSSVTATHHLQIDLTNPVAIERDFPVWLAGVETLDLVVLNAGILGKINDLHKTPTADAKHVMEVNLWANKSVMDWLHASGIQITQVIMMSSGASKLGNRGWAGYALSKAALNMLAALYANEFPNTHISALAPGIIDTVMMDHLCEEADAETYPALKRLRAARGTEAMPGPEQAADNILSVLDQLKERPSGAFIDIRELLDPESFSALYQR